MKRDLTSRFSTTTPLTLNFQGGGVANDYHNETDAVEFGTYAKEVLGAVPDLKNYHIITEFGRSVFTKQGISISKIETVKDWGDRFV